MITYRILLISIIFFISGCAAKIPKDAFVLSATSLQDRQIQTRLFETKDETSILAASIGVLQDLGYSVDETEKNVGLITTSKTVDATDNTQVVGAIFLALLGGGSVPIDDIQKIRVSLVTSPSKNHNDSYLARVTFQRIIWNTQGKISRAETLKDAALYIEFFDKLSKSVFLEAHKI